MEQPLLAAVRQTAEYWAREYPGETLVADSDGWDASAWTMDRRATGFDACDAFDALEKEFGRDVAWQFYRATLHAEVERLVASERPTREMVQP